MSYDVETGFHSITCRYCGQPFKTRFGRKRYCSDLCYSRAHPRKAARYPRWTHKDIRMLRELAGTMSVADLAARIGRTRAAVQARAHQLKISLIRYGQYHPAAKYSDETVERARTLHDEGMPPVQIAAQLGIPKGTIRDYLNYRWRLGPCPERYI